MGRLSYDTADTLVYDPVTAHRNATKAVLYTIGFRNIETCATLEQLAQAMTVAPPDLMLCEAHGAEAELCDLIQALRLGMAGNANPFLVIIVTAWEKNETLVHRVLHSGADDLILRPFSTALLGGRIESHVERRKSFVITYDYVGPDRRSEVERPSKADLFQPPNSLKMKVRDGLTGADAQQKLSEVLRSAKDALANEKLRRDAFQVCILWRLMQEPGEAQAEELLAKLRELVPSIAKRCRAASLEAALHWSDSVLAAVEGLQFGIDRNASMHLLGQGALGLNQVISPEHPKSDHIRALDAAIAAIRARSSKKVGETADLETVAAAE
jgi:Response regulator containing a CheY-like receiver domain and an HD-GYP domain